MTARVRVRSACILACALLSALPACVLRNPPDIGGKTESETVMVTYTATIKGSADVAIGGQRVKLTRTSSRTADKDETVSFFFHPTQTQGATITTSLTIPKYRGPDRYTIEKRDLRDRLPTAEDGFSLGGPSLSVTVAQALGTGIELSEPIQPCTVTITSRYVGRIECPRLGDGSQAVTRASISWLKS